MEDSPLYQVEIANCQGRVEIDVARIRQAVAVVLVGEHVSNAEISVAIVDDEEIHSLNRQYLEHDYPTDVLSFLLSEDPDCLEGEIILSADTAARLAEEFGCPPMDEVCLYVVHGLLHLTGHDDATHAERLAMRLKETDYLALLGIHRPGSEEDCEA